MPDGTPHPIEYRAETGSTSTDLAARLRAGDPVAEGDWLVADRQSAGRGRQGREWFDGAGNFMGSTVVRVGPGDPPPSSLALVAGLSLHDTLAPLLGDASPMLKWPNDVLVNGAKLAGILLEREGEAVIVGVGVNLAVAPVLPDRPTVSLAALGGDPSRDLFAEALAAAFARDLERWRLYGLGPVVARWLAVGHPAGTPLRVEDGVSGTFVGLSSEGALQLRLTDGTTRTVHSGEVTLAAPRGRET